MFVMVYQNVGKKAFFLTSNAGSKKRGDLNRPPSSIMPEKSTNGNFVGTYYDIVR